MSTLGRVPDVAPADATEVLTDVHKCIVGTNASVDERLKSDPDIVPWVERELRDLMRYISASGAAPLKPRNRSAPTEQPADVPAG